MTSTEMTVTGERADLLETLAKHRHFLRYTVRDLTDEQAALRTSVSQLCLGGADQARHVRRAAVELVANLPDLDASHPLPEALPSVDRC